MGCEVGRSGLLEFCDGVVCLVVPLRRGLDGRCRGLACWAGVPAGGLVPAVFLQDEEVGWGEVLAVGEVDEVEDGGAVDAGERGEKVGAGPAAAGFAAGVLAGLAGPLLVFAEVGGAHGADAAGIQARLAGAGVDVAGGVGEAPSVGLAPGGPWAQPVAAGELGGDLAVAQAEVAHPLAQGVLDGPVAGPGVSHCSCLPAGPAGGWHADGVRSGSTVTV